MRNPLESWEKSDSGYCLDSLACHSCEENRNDCKEHIDGHDYILGPNDQKLMMTLRNAGTDHRKFMRMITVYVDITAPLYWWKEFDTYKIATVANSCSTMHKIHAKEFDISDFSTDHLLPTSIQCIKSTINDLNYYRNLYLNGGDICFGTVEETIHYAPKSKDIWWQMIQLLPTSYNQKRTVMLNYEVLANIYKSRKDHKLDEWRDFCDWIKTLPYSELIVGKSDADDEEKEKHPLPSPDKVNKLFNEVMRVDGQVRSYKVYDKLGMKILDFYDANHKSLYAFDLYRVTLGEALAFIKEEIVKLTQQNLELGA